MSPQPVDFQAVKVMSTFLYTIPFSCSLFLSVEDAHAGLHRPLKPDLPSLVVLPLGWLWWLEQKHPCVLARFQPDLEDSNTPPHLYECPWHLRESHGRQEVVAKPGLSEGSPQSAMLSSDCLVFRRHWAISGNVSPQRVARFFPNILSYSSESSLAALLLLSFISSASLLLVLQ